MSKKILFMSSAKLTVLSIGLLLAVFCTIGMSFTPAEEGDNVGNPNDSTYVSGPRRGHSTDGCTGKETNTKDYAKTIAVSLGNGTVYVSTSQTERTGQTGTTGTPGEANSTSYITWNCGAVKANDTQIKYCWAIPKTGYHFLKWTKNSDGSGSTSTENPYSFSVTAASENESSPTEGKIYAVFEANPTYTATFKVATNGSYTYQYGTNAAVTVTTEQSVTTNMNFVLTATPASGYKVFGWYTLSGTTKTYFEYLSTSIPSYALTGNTTIGVDFVPSSLALFTIKGTSSVYADLNEAATAAASSTSKIVVPTSNGTVPAGNYTIPANVTLLIPFDAAYTCYTTTPEDPCVAPSGLGVFRKLTLANNAKITVANKGAISVSAMSQGGQPYGGSVHGKYGQIDMKAGSTITLQNGANLYCWGYITGAGEITAQSGSKVYEDFQVACWRGGSAASGMVNNEKKVFPLAQYYIQNIEAKTIFNAGALEYAFTSVSINSTSTSTTAQIVGTTSGLFQISSGTLTKWYNYTDDRQMYELEGNASIGTVQISVSVSFISANIKSQDYVLPLTNNMDITVKSGTMSCNQKIAILPGAKIVVNEGANVSLGTDSELYVYDKDEWPNDGTTAFNYPNVAFKKVNYTPSTITKPRTYANMNDAVMDINGTLTTGSGHFYTTQGKANICSSNGTGKVIWTKAPASGTPAAGSKDYTYQATQSGTSISYTSIPITPAQLHNDETLYSSPYNYTATAGTAAGTTIEYHHGHWGWATIWKDADGTTILHCELGKDRPQGNYTYTPASGYAFDGWTTTTDNTNKETVYTATIHSLVTQYTITTAVSPAGTGNVTGGGTYDENTSATLTAAANTGYHFVEWQDHNTTNPRTVTVTGNATYTATFAANTYNVRFNGNGATSGTMSNQPFDYGESKALTSNAFNRTGYTFAGWATSAGGAVVHANGATVSNLSSTNGATVDLYAKWTPISYTVRFNANEGTGTMSNQSFQYGESKALTTNTFTRTGYTFAGWATSVSGAVVHTDGKTVSNLSSTQGAIVDLYAKWTENSYNVTFYNGGHGTVQVAGVTIANGGLASVNHFTTKTLAATASTGYTFAGWTKTGSVTIGNTSNASTTITAQATGGTVTATWTPTPYTISYTLNGGSVTPANPESYTIESAAITLTNPTKTGYTFAGWTGTGLGSATTTVTIAAGSTGNRTYTATWNPISYSITYNNLEGASNSNPANYTIESANITLANPGTRDGYTFAGWYTDAEFNTLAGTPAITTGSTGAKTFYAKWTLDETGDYLDIVDAQDGYLTINMTPLAASGWPYQVNGTAYGRKAGSGDVLCNDDRTIRITHDKSAGQQLVITVKNGAGYATTISRHQYIVPKVYESGGTLSGTDANSIVFVRGGTLTVSGTQAVKALYVAPGAELNIAQGGTLTVEKLVLRTSPWSAAILTKAGTLNATKVYYSRQVADNSGYFQFGLPLSTTCNVEDVTLSDGSKPTYGSAWILKSYNQASRATYGVAEDPKTQNNWKMLPGDNPVTGGVGYEIFSGSKYYREFYFPVDMTALTNSVPVTRTEGAAGAANAGWNVVCSPLMNVYIVSPAPEGMVFSWLREGGDYEQLPVTEVKPAIPFSYQAKASGNITFGNDITVPSAIAARRVAAAEEPTRIQWIHLDIEDEAGIGDQTSIYSHPTRYEQTYQTGIDVAKQSLTASRAIIYSSHAYGEMAFAGVADTLLESGVALTVYSPSAQELTFSLRENDWLNRMESVWLIDKEEGMRIDLLNGYYTFNASEGTTRGRFFIRGQFKAPQVTTDIQNGAGIEEGARKVLIDQKIYIEVNGRLYDATGKIVSK